MNKRKKREEKVAKNLKEMQDYRNYKITKQEERRSAAKTRVSKRNLDWEKESLRSYNE